MALMTALFGWMVSVTPKEFLERFTVFTLACVVGYYAVRNVSYTLYAPLMSVTSAIPGTTIIGALLQIGQGDWVSLLNFIAVLIASISIFGGFTMTQRMLRMSRED